MLYSLIDGEDGDISGAGEVSVVEKGSEGTEYSVGSVRGHEYPVEIIGPRKRQGRLVNGALMVQETFGFFSKKFRDF
jgi:hypothetical protein